MTTRSVTPQNISRDPKFAAKLASLRYSDDSRPGLTRRGAGKGFAYYAVDGSLIKEQSLREQLKALAIPPAWTDVWISPHPDGHILATGFDAAQRKQYVYHPRWHELRKVANFSRLHSFGEKLSALRDQVDSDMRKHGLPRQRVIATAVHLLEITLIRVGSAEYAETNETYGLTTLRDEHVDVGMEKIQFEFRGKSGKEHEILVNDPRTARILRRCHELPGQQLFQYINDNDEPECIDSGDVNDYIRETMGNDFSAKDFRTWGGSVSAVREFAKQPAETDSLTDNNLEKIVVAVVKKAAQSLGNTPAVTRQHYIHPAIISAFQQGQLLKLKGQLKDDDEQVSRWLDLDEQVLMELLRSADTQLPEFSG